jgi:molecular chaperone Hsp33
MTDDGGFRVITARTTDTVRRAVEAQRATGATARALGELITGAVLYRETMAPNLRVQSIIHGTGNEGQLVADSLPSGGARGLVRLPDGAKAVNVRPGAVLQMMRTLPRGDLHRGVVAVPESGTISDALMVYMQESEQIVSMISVGCSIEGDRVKAAGGYVVQLLPELEEPMLAIMTQRLKDFRDVEQHFDTAAATPETLLDELLYSMPYTRLHHSDIQFECACSEVRVMTTLASLPRSDIEELMRDGGDIEMTCDYCGMEYHVPPEQLRGLLEDS